MRLQKTEKAKAELAPGGRTLGQRQRTLLLMADGRKTLADFSSLFNGDARIIITQLIDEGYLVGEKLSELALERSSSTGRSSKQSAPVSREAPKNNVSVNAPHSADPFEGKRSLATARMFLFDIVERMFTRRAPQLAEQFRDALRNARDRDSMLAVARVVITEVEVIAGHERADSISERIAMLLPVQD